MRSALKAHQPMNNGVAIAEAIGFKIFPGGIQPAGYATYPLPLGEDLD